MTPDPGSRFLAWFPLRRWTCFTTLALLSACAHHSTAPQMSGPQEAARYAARASHNYDPPGPPSDPWGPYIDEAANRFDIPDRWVREVIRAESSYQVFDTSQVGAMGLMQVMPETYDELRARYDLGDDPYDPHNNILAGTAYLREMYDLYGNPGFLAAYNAGPGKLDDYLMRNRPLPDETRHYVAKIGPRILGVEPIHVSAAQNVAMNQLPLYIPAGPRYPVHTHTAAPVALAENRAGRSDYARVAVQSTTLLPEPPIPAPPPRPVVMAAAAPSAKPGGFHIIAPAMAETVHHGAAAGSGNWAIQVGAFGNANLARAAADSARSRGGEVLAVAQPAVGAVHQASATLYRARLTGLSREAAVQACEKLSHARGSCIVLSPDAQQG